MKTNIYSIRVSGRGHSRNIVVYDSNEWQAELKATGEFERITGIDADDPELMVSTSEL